MTTKSEETERAREIDDAVKSADAAKAKAAADAARADQEASSKIDRILACLDALGARMDSMEEAEKAGKAAGAQSHLEADSDEDKDEERQKGEAKKLAADKRTDSVRADAEKEEIEAFRAETGSEYEIKADSVLANIQSCADKASSSWGRSAPAPWDGERIPNYRRRVAREHQQHSPQWKGVDLAQLSGQSLRVASAQIFADSIAASSSPSSYGEDALRVVTRRNPDTGHLVKEYFGHPRSWMSMFSGERRYASFNRDAISKSMGG